MDLVSKYIEIEEGKYKVTGGHVLGMKSLTRVNIEFLTVHDKMEASLRDLSRTGEVQPCKAARKASESSLKELSKDLKPLLGFLQSSGQAAHILPKVEELVAKERELVEKLWLKQSTVVESFEKKSSAKDTDSRVAAIQQKITTLRQEVDDLVDVLDEI